MRDNHILLEIIIANKHTQKKLVSEMAGRWSIIPSYTETYTV